MTLPRAVHATAPTRVDLAGGTLDIWPLAHMIDGPVVTLNMAIDILTEATVTPRDDASVVLTSLDREEVVAFPDRASIHHDHKLGLLSRLADHFLPADGPGVDIVTRSDAPAGAGIAGSSALNIALTAALSKYVGKPLKGNGLIDVAKDIEAALLRTPTGLQDYGAAVHGGLNCFAFPAGGMTRERLTDAERLLPARLLLFYSGATRNSGINNWEMFRRLIEKERRAVAGFARIAEAAWIAAEALREGDMATFDAAVAAEWKARRALFPAISTPVIDAAMTAAKRNGATAGRICGAGGGGCFFVLADPDRHAKLRGAVEKTGATFLPFVLSETGVTSYNPR
ncbi:MAG: hypothetical protein HQK87_01710 [Nitrospinae bacterium]|nr:hypothetical protein [Nitrospinota bacterium]